MERPRRRAKGIGAAALLALLLPAGQSIPDALAAAAEKKRAAMGILKALEGSGAEAAEKIARSKEAIALLEEARAILDPIPEERAGEIPAEVNSLLFWARKMMPIAAAPPRLPPAPARSASPEPPPVRIDPPKPPPEPPPSRPAEPPAEPEDREAAAAEALADAGGYEERHPEDPFMLAVRYLEVAVRFKGTSPSLEAQEKALDYQRRMMDEIRARRAEPEPAATPPPEAPPAATAEPPPEPAPARPVEAPPPARGRILGDPSRLGFDRVEAGAGLYAAPNARLGGDLHYLWAELRFSRGGAPAAPTDLSVRAFHERRSAPGTHLGTTGAGLSEASWRETPHGPDWCLYSHEPPEDRAEIEKRGIPRRLAHAHAGTLFVFVNCLSEADPEEIASQQVRIQIRDPKRDTLLYESEPIPIRIGPAGAAGPAIAAEPAVPPPAAGEAQAGDGALAIRLHDEAMEAARGGRNAAAEALLRRALSAWEKAGEGDSLPAAHALQNLGGVLGREGRMPEAEACFRRAVAAFERAGETAGPGLVTALENFANLLEATGRRAESRAARERAFRIRMDRAAASADAGEP